MQISSLFPLLNTTAEDITAQEPAQELSFTEQLQILQTTISEPNLNIELNDEPRVDLKIELEQDLQENLTDNQGDLLEFFNFFLPTVLPLEINPNDALQKGGIVFSAEVPSVVEPETLVDTDAYQKLPTKSDNTLKELLITTPLQEENVLPAVNLETNSEDLAPIEVTKTIPSNPLNIEVESIIQKNNRATVSTFTLDEVEVPVDYEESELNQLKPKELPRSPLISAPGSEGLLSEQRSFNPNFFSQSTAAQELSKENSSEQNLEAEISVRTEMLPQTIKNQTLVLEKNISFQPKANEQADTAKPVMELIPNDILLNNGQIHKASLKLDQGDMGVVSAQIEILEQKSTVTMTVETQEAKHLLQGHVSQLKEVFDNAELVLSQFNVDQEAPRERKKQLTDERSNGQMRKTTEASVSEISGVSSGTNSQLIIDTYA